MLRASHAFFLPPLSLGFAALIARLVSPQKAPLPLREFSLNFYWGQALALFRVRRPRINFLSIFLQERGAAHLSLDGFFFPYRTHAGYSFRSLGLFASSRPLARTPRTKKLSFYAPAVSLRPFGKIKSVCNRLLSDNRKTPPRALAAFLRRRKRRTWLVRWAPTFAGMGVQAVNSSFPSFSSNSHGALRNPHAPTWFLEAARFKPGFSTEWRKSRLAFNHAWGLNYLRQRRLTRFFLRLKGLGGFSFLRLITLSAGQVLSASFTCLIGNFFGPLKLAAWACRLNGRLITNPFIQLFSGDILQFLISGATAPFWALKLSRKKFNAFLRDQFTWDKTSLFSSDIPTFLEVDELSLTSVILDNPDLEALLPYVQTGPAPYLTFKLYNWKYTT